MTATNPMLPINTVLWLIRSLLEMVNSRNEGMKITSIYFISVWNSLQLKKFYVQFCNLHNYVYLMKSAFLGAKFHSHNWNYSESPTLSTQSISRISFFSSRTVVKSNQLLREFRLKAQKYVEVIHIVIIIIPKICSLFLWSL